MMLRGNHLKLPSLKGGWAGGKAIANGNKKTGTFQATMWLDLRTLAPRLPDSAVHQMNLYQLDSTTGFPNLYAAAFEQLGPIIMPFRVSVVEGYLP